MNLIKANIPKRHTHCSEDSRPFNPGDICYTFMSVDSKGWYRKDLCEACWHNLKKDNRLPQLKSHWQTKIPSQKVGREEAPKNKEERVLFLLKEASAKTTPFHQQEAFILALYLARKKALSLRQEIEQLGETICLYEVAATEELIPIKKAWLTPKEIAAQQTHLASLLSHHA